MRILHLDLQPSGDTRVELRYFFDNPNDYQERSAPRQDIADLIQQAEADYYVPAALQDLVGTGRRLYQWLDGSDRWLERALTEAGKTPIALAISAAEALAHLPWEVLHDGSTFLVQRLPAVVPVRWVTQTSQPLQLDSNTQNRALQVMFMATSPRGIEPVLDYELEEAQILEATARQPISLIVEESGCLSELYYAMADYEPGQFDGLHLSGHATFVDNQPRFITETETGDPDYASAQDIAGTLQTYLPKLVFLSGCRTGQAAQTGAVPSMAEALLQNGAVAVLSWGQKVLDTDASTAAATLYGALGQGQTLAQALARTYQALLAADARDWHLLRLYVAETLPAALVTAPRTPRRIRAPRPSVSSEFLDPDTQQVKVVGREGFVGRRRQIQACLRSFQNPELAGVLIHGMGGLGKSALAARLCDRLSQYQRIVSIGRLDEPKLVRKLSEKLTEQPLREALQNPNDELRFRLRSVFAQLADQNQPLLLVLDDFEANLEAQNGGYVPTAKGAALLEALVWAMAETDSVHRLIITSRYDFEFSLGRTFYKQPLEALRGADLQKKCDRLPGFERPSLQRQATEAEQAAAQAALARQQTAKQLADGNPRLLEWLDKILQGESPLQQDSGLDVDAILSRLDENPVELREQVLAQTLLAQMDAPLRDMLRRGRVYELPVPQAALAPLWQEIADWPQRQERAVALGLLEVSPLGALRVPRILPLPEPEEGLYETAAQQLYQLWWLADGASVNEEQALELVRLGLLTNNPEIAAELAHRVASHWVNRSRYMESRELCRLVLEKFEDYRILHTLARAEEVVGSLTDAIVHYREALRLCPEEDKQVKSAIHGSLASVISAQGHIREARACLQKSLELDKKIEDVRGEAITLNDMAIVMADQGNIEEAEKLLQRSLVLFESIDNLEDKLEGRATVLSNLASVRVQKGDFEGALSLWNEDLEISECIGDIQGEAVTLDNIARVRAQQGDVKEALRLWNEVLERFRRTGDLRGEAATLIIMASFAEETGDRFRQLELNLQAVQALGQVREFQDLFTVLTNLARSAEAKPDVYLAQATWLGLRIQTSLTDILNLIRYFFNQVPQGDALEALLAATWIAVCNSRGQEHPQLEEFQQTGIKMLSAAATAQGIKTEKAFMEWLSAQQLNQRSVVLSRLNQQLEAIVGDEWLFDRSHFG